MSCIIDPDFTLDFLASALQEHKAILAKHENDTSRDAQLAAVYCDGAEELLAQYGKTGFPQTIQAMLHGIRIGDLALLGAPFEMMQGIRREVCAASITPYPAVLSLCGDSLGYPGWESLNR